MTAPAPRVECRLVTMADWYGLAAQNSPRAAAEYRAASREIASGRVAGVFVDGSPLFIGAVSSVGTIGAGVAWCIVADGGIASCSVRVVRAVRRHFDAVAQFHDRVVAVVSDANPAGQRLAALVGFVPREAVALGFRIWELPYGGNCVGSAGGGRSRLFGRHAVEAGQGNEAPAR